MSVTEQPEIERQGYLGDVDFIDQILKNFFSGIESNLQKWEKEGIAGDLAQKSVNEAITGISEIFEGKDPAYLSMPAWNGLPLAAWLLKNTDLPFPEGAEGLSIIQLYFTILTATFMQGWQAHQQGNLDALQWTDWKEAMRRKMRLQLIGAPG